jgi:hypothetical protein
MLTWKLSNAIRTATLSFVVLGLTACASTKDGYGRFMALEDKALENYLIGAWEEVDDPTNVTVFTPDGKWESFVWVRGKFNLSIAGTFKVEGRQTIESGECVGFKCDFSISNERFVMESITSNEHTSVAVDGSSRPRYRRIEWPAYSTK